MTLAEKIKDLFGQEYNDIDPELLDVKIRELKPSDIMPLFDETWKIDPLRNVFQRETIGVMLYTDYSNVINIRFEEEVYDTIEALRTQSEQFKA